MRIEICTTDSGILMSYFNGLQSYMIQYYHGTEEIEYFFKGEKVESSRIDEDSRSFMVRLLVLSLQVEENTKEKMEKIGLI